MSDILNEDAARDERHRLRMQRKKGVIDNKIAAADTERGVLLVLTGNGKGKARRPSAWWRGRWATA